jgi:hypothetical protein
VRGPRIVVEQRQKALRSERRTPELSKFPDLVVIYLGMKVKSPRGIKTLLGFGPKIQRAVSQNPDGLLLHENLMFSLFPLHLGMREYWRDFDSLERWARSGVHKDWWQHYLHNPGGTGFWHELYVRNAEIEGAFVDIDQTGMTRFAPTIPSRGTMFSARRRLRRQGAEDLQTAYSEEELYGATE